MSRNRMAPAPADESRDARWRIRSWAALTVTLYGATLAVLLTPLGAAAFIGYSGDALKTAFEWYASWPFWIVIGGLMLAEALLLLVPIQVARHRPIPRARWTLLAAVAGLMMTILMGGLLYVLLETFLGDQAPFRPLDPAPSDAWILAVLALAAWGFWGAVFWWCTRRGVPETALRRTVRILLAGSTVELLVAVPCHVIVRCRDYCCAGALTFFGLAAGLSVLFFAFGPGVFLLFVDRARRLRGEPPARVPRAAPAGIATALGPHGRDAAAWAAMGLISLAAIPVSGWAAADGSDAIRDFGLRTAFIVFSAAACLHALRAGLGRERLWGLAAVGASYLAEGILFAAWWQMAGR